MSDQSLRCLLSGKLRTHFQLYGVFVCCFFPLIFISYYKQTEKILIRHRMMRCLIWVCTICICPIKRTLCFIWVNPIHIQCASGYSCPWGHITTRMVFYIPGDWLGLNKPYRPGRKAVSCGFFNLRLYSLPFRGFSIQSV